jgi:hypothetical protein
MRVLLLLVIIAGMMVPMFSSAKIISIILPDSYEGYQPVGLIKTSDSYILAGNAKHAEKSWDVSILWLSDNYSTIRHKLFRGNSSDLVSKILSVNKEHFLLLTNTASDSGDFKKIYGILDIGISRLDSNGNRIWTKTLGGTGINHAQNLFVSEDQQTITVLGWVNAGGGNLPGSYGGWDIVAAQYDAHGETRWITTLGSAEDDMTGSILSRGENVYLVYNSWVKGRNWEIKFVTLNTHGKILHEKSYGGHGSELVHKVIPTPDGNFLILGSTDSIDTELGKSQGKIDIWIVKIDSAGNIIWKTRLGGSEDDLGHDIVYGLDGSYWVLGMTQSHDGDITEHIGGWDICIFKIDRNGNLTDSETYGTLNDDQPIQILAMQSSILFLSGTKRTEILSEPFFIKKDY